MINIKTRKIIKTIILIPLLCILAFSSYKLFMELYPRYEAKKAYSYLDRFAISSKEDKEQGRKIDVDFDALKAVNEDCIGWLYLEDSAINYPVVKGDDNFYYLSHLYDNSYNANGSVFMDHRNAEPFKDDNSIIYGHRMHPTVMFWELPMYEDQNYYNSHKYIYFETPEKEYRLEVFAGYVTPSTSDSYTMDFNKKVPLDEKEASDNSEDGEWNEESEQIDEAQSLKENEKVESIPLVWKYGEETPTFDEWYKSVKSQSSFKSDVKVTKEDKIVTFSTCETTNLWNGRFVLHCKVMETDAN